MYHTNFDLYLIIIRLAGPKNVNGPTGTMDEYSIVVYRIAGASPYLRTSEISPKSFDLDGANSGILTQRLLLGLCAQEVQEAAYKLSFLPLHSVPSVQRIAVSKESRFDASRDQLYVRTVYMSLQTDCETDCDNEKSQYFSLKRAIVSLTIGNYDTGSA
ncbi:hypothetical protein GYMLUDRAFT_46668 [Collybiopsis luxurians FD-317 M1]|uniref:Unplaced genomic scaffold GYMLUscaffold_45, whole genome shotgun sequence n=1 Tax=Collybiopsis luxurians FD-317 M1 TaxID=944289 RepID=A0A0D0BPR2_9AGAR|nr:hypothetical protein GYMLUDRAFT_46668 [Collybiopsis luxurians FD-317 M1]